MALKNNSAKPWLESWGRPLIKRYAALDAFFRKQFRPNSLATWFLRALRSQDHQARAGWGAPNGNYYEFGVGRGRTMMRFIKALKLYCRLAGIDPYSYSIFGFDSFEGLPAKESDRDDHPGWHQRQFDYGVEKIRLRVTEQLDLSQGSVRFIRGFFKDSLTPELAAELSSHPPSIVTIDVDYYSSTKVVLDWLSRIAPSGCLFYFDDLWAFYGHPEMGEIGAINEFNRGAAGYLVPYPELGTTVGGRTYVFVRRNFEYGTEGRDARATGGGALPA
ncbi:MAG TPA: TylF/MycF/NovP-related O-methyltransferase [Candidatus Binataceae bacterium]